MYLRDSELTQDQKSMATFSDSATQSLYSTKLEGDLDESSPLLTSAAHSIQSTNTAPYKSLLVIGSNPHLAQTSRPPSQQLPLSFQPDFLDVGEGTGNSSNFQDRPSAGDAGELQLFV